MARVSAAQVIQQENEQQALAFFEAALKALPDPRRAQGRRYPLRTVVVTALMAMVCGCDDAESMELWGECNAEWLAGILDLPHGTPTQDVFLAVFGALDPAAFSAAFRAWASLLTLRLKAEGRQIAVDGKTSRGSSSPTYGTLAVHTVSAWLCDAGLVLGQLKTGEKSNEIKAVPELLRVLDIKGATVTLDAMGCQTEIAKTIIAGAGNYLIAVKDNQPTLRQDIEATFVQAADDRVRSCDELERPAVEVSEETDKGHGRVEKRTVQLCRDLSVLTTAESWAGLSFVAQVIRERTMLATGKTSTEVAYYIGSDRQATATTAGRTIRRHWGIETELHWVLDLAFREDEARHRARNTAQNLATLRHFALNVIKQDKRRKVGVATARKRAGWDRNYLLELLVAAGA
jgi:predicted transposase YbfD/YdcC